MNIEFGDFNDNMEVFSTILCRMRNGSVEAGLRIFRELRNHIILTGESKSIEWLLPKLDLYLSQNNTSPILMPEKFCIGISPHVCA